MQRRIVLLLLIGLTQLVLAADSDQEWSEKRSPVCERTAAERKRAIRLELEQGAKDAPWAGEYREGDGTGVNVTLLFAPLSGFVFEWNGCMGLYDRNYGAVQSDASGIHLQCELPNHPGKGFQGIDPHLILVKWGERNYLVPDAEMIAFYNAINSGEEPRSEAMGNFLFRVGDEKKHVTGQPTMPDGAAKFLLREPLNAKIVRVEKSSWKRKYGSNHRFTPVFIDLGIKHGVFVGQEFFRSPSGVWGNVASLKDGHATLIFEQDAKDPPPRVGWKLSTRAPWNSHDE